MDARPAAPRHRRLGRRRQVHADRPPAARLEAAARATTSRPCRATATGPTSPRSPTACAPSASRASRSTSPTASSPRRGARSSSPTRPGTSATRATWSPARRPPTSAIVLIDARNGLLEQSRRHADLSALLGIRHLVACVNKMDLVDWDEERFREIETRVRRAGRSGSSIPDADGDPDLRAARRQRRRPLDAHALVRRAAAARAPRDGRGRARPQPRRRAPPGAVDDPPARRRDRGATRASSPAASLRSRATRWSVCRRARARRSRRSTRSTARREPRVPPLSVAVRLEDELDVGPRRPRLRPGDAPVVGARARRHRLLDGRGPAAARRALRAQAHDPHRARDRAGRSTPRCDIDDARGREPRPRRSAQRHRPHHAAHRAPVLADPYADNRVDRRVHPHRRAHQRHRRAPGMVEEARERRAAEPERARRHLAPVRARRATSAGSALGAARRDGLADRAAGVGQVDDRRRARARAGGGRAPPTCSTATTSATGCPATSASSPATAPRTSAASPTSRGCSPTPAWSPSSRSCRPFAADREARRASCTRPPGCRSSRCFVDTAGRGVRAPRPQGPVREGPRRASCPGFTGVDAPYEAPEDPEVHIAGADSSVDDAVEAIFRRLEQDR